MSVCFFGARDARRAPVRRHSTHNAPQYAMFHIQRVCSGARVIYVCMMGWIRERERECALGTRERVRTLVIYAPDI